MGLTLLKLHPQEATQSSDWEECEDVWFIAIRHLMCFVKDQGPKFARRTFRKATWVLALVYMMLLETTATWMTTTVPECEGSLTCKKVCQCDYYQCCFILQTLPCAQQLCHLDTRVLLFVNFGGSKGKVHDRDIEMGSAGNAGSGKELPAAGTTMSATICILTNLWHSACWRWQIKHAKKAKQRLKVYPISCAWVRAGL